MGDRGEDIFQLRYSVSPFYCDICWRDVEGNGEGCYVVGRKGGGAPVGIYTEPMSLRECREKVEENKDRMGLREEGCLGVLVENSKRVFLFEKSVFLERSKAS